MSSDPAATGAQVTYPGNRLQRTGIGSADLP